ncbi:competence protein CoiA family protein [Bacillus sp. DX4.1]|uniref:competence protein CoiA n=1 Tax=Bacillus sp. DX4.1 TaxID=3055867 RepID=UPI0025A0417B|nr:competence protein CoiA family protein [Bacillus sp. DX4.1]MDM5187497.1 competence protein CoiA family protein [Bacillus sp. DX4.1]
MFVAKRENGEKIHLLHNWDEKQLLTLRKNDRFFCPICHLEVQLKLGKQKRWHFAHKKTNNCLIEYEHESAYHMHGKEQLYKWIQSQGFHVEIEYYLKAIRQRPDLFIEMEGRKFAIEYQCASLSADQLLKRTYSYWKAGIQIVWILGGNQLKRHSASWISLSSFHSLCIQSYPQPSLLFFCPNDKAFLKCTLLTPFSSNVHFTHIIHLPLRNLTFTSLFHSTVLSKERLQQEWQNKKNYFRTNILPIWNYSHKALLRILYHYHLTPSCFPSEIGVPLPSAFAFRTHPFVWQAYLLMNFIERHEAGEYFSLHAVFSYMSQHKSIQLRALPYFPKNIWKEAVTEYLTFLCGIGVLEEVAPQKYRKVGHFVIPQTEADIIEYDAICLSHALSLFEAKYNMREGKVDIIKG